jgi:hypothetical protein
MPAAAPVAGPGTNVNWMEKLLPRRTPSAGPAAGITVSIVASI